jgi:hypothetical protein
MVTPSADKHKQRQSHYPQRLHSNNNSSQQNYQRRNVGGSHHHNKRQHPSTQSSSWTGNKYEEDEVDDLAVAAQYAFAVPTSMASVSPLPVLLDDGIVEDENEIDLDSSVSSEMHPIEQSVDIETNTTLNVLSDQNVDDVNEDDNDDAESDVDLIEQLAQMVGEDEEEDVDDDDDNNNDVDTTTNQKSNKVRNKPMTVNEIDAYQADLSEIHDLLQWNVSIAAADQAITKSISIQEEQKSSTVDFQSKKEKSIQQYHIAGHIQHHMIDERTIVLLSVQGGVLLKEGTTLYIQTQDIVTQSSNSDTLATSSKADTCIRTTSTIIQLGNILEIFGPVSQPLYSVRLPLPLIVDKVNGGHKLIPSNDYVKDEQSLDSEEVVPAPIPSTETTNGLEEFKRKDDSEITITAPLQEFVVSTSPINIDKWSKGGEYTKVLQKFPKLPVYYCNDPSSTNILDTDAVYRNSGRGCDASNIFDEEIDDVQDYSDDEQERVAKGNKKKSLTIVGNDTVRRDNYRALGPTNHRNNAGHQRTLAGSNRAPSQFNQSRYASGQSIYNPPPNGFHPQQILYPPGFHVGGVAPFYPSYPANVYPPQNPPSVAFNPSQFATAQAAYIQQPQYQQPWYYYNGAYQTIPPPPPPPPTTTTTTTQQYPPSAQSGPSDTVYYDFS